MSTHECRGDKLFGMKDVILFKKSISTLRLFVDGALVLALVPRPDPFNMDYSIKQSFEVN